MSAKPPTWTPRREKSVLPPMAGEEAELSTRDLPSNPLLLLRPTERGATAGGSISTMASLRLSAPPSVGTLGRRECRAASPWPCVGLSDRGSRSAPARGVGT